MTRILAVVAASALLASWPAGADAQTADEIVEKHLAASGGRTTLSRLTSRTTSGTITLTSPAGELAGTIELYTEPPNKSRTLIKMDLSALGAGQVVSDQRFDGTTGYVIDTFNGNREITGSQLDAMRVGAFPTPLLNYREAGLAIELAGTEKLGAADAYVLRLTPKTGPVARVFIDAQNLLVVRTIVTIDVPQLGGDIEQVIDFADFRDVDGVKVPFTTRSANPAQTAVATMKDVRHNVELDDSMFVRPAAQ